MTEFQIRPVQEQDKAAFLSLCRRFYNSPAVLHPIPEAYHARTFEELMGDGPYLRGYLLLQGKSGGFFTAHSRGKAACRCCGESPAQR